MAKIKNLKIIFLVLALVLMGLFVYLSIFYQKENQQNLSNKESFALSSTDKIKPYSILISPQDKSWRNFDFEAEVLDSDSGGSGLVDFIDGKQGCKYIIEDLGNNVSMQGFYPCGSSKIIVSVGKDKACSTSYQKDNISFGKCQVSVKSYDKAGNESFWQSRIFNIDLIKPEVGPPAISEVGAPNVSLELDKEYNFSATTSDNAKIAGCWLYLNDKIQENQVEINPLPCKDENICGLSTKLFFEKEGNYNLKFGCADSASNFTYGKEIMIKATTNHAPEIKSCRVLPLEGNLQTEFKFTAEVSDMDGDKISYLWDFGDSNTSKEESPSHYYQEPGTFEPKLIVDDGRGKKSECQTAWAIVSQ